MKGFFVFALIALVGFALAVEVEQEAGIYVLSPANFDDFVAENKYTLVEFYAPWCGHCKKLAPEYEAASALVSNAKLAKVDGSEHQALAQKYGVTGFPTLVWFTDGEPTPYAGGRTKDTIVAWVNKATISEIPSVNAEELAAAKEEAEYATIILFGGAADDAAHKEILEFFRAADDVTVATVYDAELITASGAADGDIVVYAKHVEEPATTTFSDFEAFVEFVSNNAYPRVVQFDNAQFSRISQQNEWILLGVTPYATEGNKDALVALLNDVEGEVGLLYADSAVMGRAVTGAGASGDVYPTFVGLNMKAQKQLVWDESKEVTVESLTAWVAALKDGTAETFKKSEPIPEANDDAVVTLVYKNFESSTEGKKALVKYYAPWCGHCKTLAPIFEELAAAVADKDIIIAKFDATANHTDEPIQGFPTLIYYDGEGNQETYQGDRTLEALQAFVEAKF